MFRINYIVVVLIGFMFSCADKPFQQTDGISFKRGGESCNDSKKHWLLDIVASREDDSVYLNTMDLNRKVEVHISQLDTTSTLVKLLAQTCEGDSLDLRLTAGKFYTSLNGSVPSNLKTTDGIQVKVNVRGKLDDLEHIAYKKAFENTMIQRFLEQNRWNTVLDTASQINYERLKTKSGGNYEYSKAKVKYQMSTLTEKIIVFSKDEDPLLYDKKDSGILGGIHFLVSKLKVGESIRAVVPSQLAFGEKGNSKVPGYMPVIMELEVLEAID